jgi:hypothetical protein
MTPTPAPQPVSKAPLTASGQPVRWTRWHTAGQLAILILIGVVGVVAPNQNVSMLLTWIVIVALMLMFLVIVGAGITGRPQGLLIDERNKMSLSRLQLVLWTLVILSGLLTAALSNIGRHSGDPLNIMVPTQVWVLMGISTTSLIGSPLLKSNKMAGRQIETRGDVHDAAVADLFRGEETSNFNVLDLAKVQMFFFTLALVLAYAVELGGQFANSTGLISMLPDIHPSMTTLLGISHAGYLANKAIPRNSPPQPTDSPDQPAG